MKVLSIVVISLSILAACGSTIPNRNPLGESFPKVEGESLAGKSFTLPGAFAGKKVILYRAGRTPEGEEILHFASPENPHQVRVEPTQEVR